ncbi:MAG: peroxiredoxin [Piscirickettsiaceae bacterium]|nr:peroxiredoxin [Piscirickettsiaceae bacterium]
MSVLVTSPAPDFVATAVMPDNSINENFSLSNFKGKYVVLFFYPLDFTFVCPSEIIAHHHRIPEFAKRGVEVIGVSIDSQFTHLAWRNTAPENGGIGQIDFPLVADIRHQIVKAYGVQHPSDAISLRGSFLIDKEGIIRHQVVNDLPLGREVDEILRLVDALQFTEEHGEVCPAGWQKGDEGIRPDSTGVASYLAKHANKL